MPSAFRVIISRQAETDLETIFHYIRHKSPHNASRVIGRILGEIDTLDFMPARYAVVARSRKRGARIHRMVVRPFLVYYRVDVSNQSVTILVIRHGTRQQPDEFE